MVHGSLLQERVGTWSPKWKWRYVSLLFDQLIVKEANVGPDGVEETEPYSDGSIDGYDSDAGEFTRKGATHVTKAKWELSEFVVGDIEAKYDESGDLILYIEKRKFRDGFTYQQGVQSQRLVRLMRELRTSPALKVPVPYSKFEREDDARIAREEAREEALRKQKRERKVAFECLSSEQLCQVLLKSEQSAYAPVFARHKISGADAVEMGEEDLIEMGIRPGVKRRAILQAFESYKATGVAAGMFE